MTHLYPILTALLLIGCGDSEGDNGIGGIQTVMHEAQISAGQHPPIDGEMPAWGYTCADTTGLGEICTPAEIHISDGEICTMTNGAQCVGITVREGETLVLYWLTAQ
jgi:hypothetical protein